MKNKILLSCAMIFSLIGKAQNTQPSANKNATSTYDKMPDILPTTKPLAEEGDLSIKMREGAHKFTEKKIDESVANRLKLRHRDLSSKEAYEKSVEPNRTRFMKYIGVEDKTRLMVNYDLGLPDKY